MPQHSFYNIGISGSPWQAKEKQQWLSAQVRIRSYQNEVVSVLQSLAEQFDLIEYGALSIDVNRYPLFALTTKNWDANKAVMLITGGVHGYETSGVHGAIQFMANHASRYTEQYNIVALPCISPWAYEHIVRWNPYTVDPNRSFHSNSPSQEAHDAMQFIQSLDGKILLHIDLHETTDSDESEFRPALAARDGETFTVESIPDGFYLVGDSENQQSTFQQAIIDNVRHVTHIAPPDDKGQIIGSDMQGEGIIYYPLKKLGLCASMTNAPYTTTTEVYPDSPQVNADDCNRAQVTAVTAAFEYISSTHTSSGCSQNSCNDR